MSHGHKLEPDVTSGSRADVQLRQAGVQDAARLAELGARLFEQAFGADNTADDMQAYLAENFFEERQARELAEPTRIVWFAEDSHRNAIGYVMFRLGTRASGVHGERPAEVERIYVDRSSHRSGVGSRLMNACIEQAVASGCDVLWLAVWERNARAIAFYEQFGFRKVGAKDFQLGSDVQRDAVMERLL